MNKIDDKVDTFLYEGNDSMINFESSGPPKKIPKAFKAQLRLRNGRVVDAPPAWRRIIWNWWHEARKDEIETNVLLQASRQMLGKCK